MLITRLYLRNFRVYEDELELFLPPGLVGIYGPNGSGKSTLLEAILFTLWGKARTSKDLIRSSGVSRECVTEVEFEHEGHLYLVRRTLKGINSTVTVEAHCDGALMSTGTRDAERYVESVLGMDDGAFRASVFTEQKQLAAFSNQAPAERRRLVLQLLGITPLDAARDAARKDARQLASDHDRLRSMLPDLGSLEVEASDSEARAAAAEVEAADEARAAETAGARAAAALTAFQAEDARRQEHDTLLVEGRAARTEMDRAEKAAAEQEQELRALQQLAGELEALDEQAVGLPEDEKAAQALVTALNASRALEKIQVPSQPAAIDRSELEELTRSADGLRQDVAATGALVQVAAASLEKARTAAGRSSELDGAGDCPTCGQPLGAAFEKVQAHRRAEIEAAEAEHRELSARLKSLTDESRRAEARLAEVGRQVEVSAKLRAEWEEAGRRRAEAEGATRLAWAEAEAAGAGAWVQSLDGADPEDPQSTPGTAVLEEAIRHGRRAIDRKREAQARALTIRGRLDGRDRLEKALETSREQAVAARSMVEALREKVKALGFTVAALEEAARQRDATGSAAQAAASAASRAAMLAVQERERARAAAERLSDARAQHARLGELESDARHRGRAADLLSEFRNTVVASVGPRLAVHAAELFGELTDHEYDSLDVDPESYQLQISDGGRLYGLDRFSGSEIDLANLALRVAISEHIHFQSGGSVGLLVLDEVFGPLDDDRKGRMLLALERLKGRFRQVLVVTHDSEIKEQLPNALEVVKLPGRRATARVLGD